LIFIIFWCIFTLTSNHFTYRFSHYYYRLILTVFHISFQRPCSPLIPMSLLFHSIHALLTFLLTTVGKFYHFKSYFIDGFLKYYISPPLFPFDDETALIWFLCWYRSIIIASRRFCAFDDIAYCFHSSFLPNIAWFWYFDKQLDDSNFSFPKTFLISALSLTLRFITKMHVHWQFYMSFHYNC
jgi:hypothetical protein